MKTSVISAVGVVVATAVFLVAILVADPFPAGTHLLFRVFHADTFENAKVSNLYQNPRTQETSHGEHPLGSFISLTEFWAKHPGDERIYLIGNSQMFSMVLAPAEHLNSGAEVTYPDLVFAHYSGEPGSKRLFYRLAAPNIDYVEALWYLHYLLAVPELKPNRIVVQLTFQTFRVVGIRDGMLELLSDPRFRVEITSSAQSEKAYVPTFREAIIRYDKRSAEMRANGAQSGGAGALAANTSRTGIAESFGFGNYVESAVRNRLERVSAWQAHSQLKSEFLDTLYFLRVFLLNIKPTTKRTIGGASLESNLGALQEISNLCRQQGIELVLMNAPGNPAAPLYLTEEDKSRYHNLIRDLATTDHLQLYDFESSIPHQFWGVWIDGPDPVHFGREGHQRMAQLVINSGIIQPKHD